MKKNTKNSVKKSNKKNEKVIINNALALQQSIDGGEGEAQTTDEKVRIIVDKHMKTMLRAKESCHYARYIVKHHSRIIDALNEAFSSFVRNDDVNENKFFFAKAIGEATGLSYENRMSTAFDVLCEFEKFINAVTENELDIVLDTRKQLVDGVACALMTTQKQTFNRLLAQEKVVEHSLADVEALEQQVKEATQDAL